MNCRPLYIVLVSCLVLSLNACSSKPDYGKATFPVTGEVYVDGQPAAVLSVTLNDVKGIDVAAPAIPTAVTTADGKFAVSTFEAADGAPAGDYVVTFVWGKMEGLSINTDIDKLKGKYADPKRSQVKLTVTEGQPTDMGRIDLTTK
jgi:hypothetical protein